MDKSVAKERNGLILIQALVVLLVISSLVSAAAMTVRISYETDKRFSKTAALRRALEAGMARARSRLSESGPRPLELEGTLSKMSFSVRGKPLDAHSYRVRVVAEAESGQQESCRAVLQVKRRDDTYSSRVVEYTESLP
ncbi:MAG: hypothetical protein V5A84_04345 [Planctomycetota bacterium]